MNFSCNFSGPQYLAWQIRTLLEYREAKTKAPFAPWHLSRTDDDEPGASSFIPLSSQNTASSVEIVNIDRAGRQFLREIWEFSDVVLLNIGRKMICSTTDKSPQHLGWNRTNKTTSSNKTLACLSAPSNPPFGASRASGKNTPKDLKELLDSSSLVPSRDRDSVHSGYTPWLD